MVFMSYRLYYEGSSVVKAGEFWKGSAYALRNSGVTGRMVRLRKGNSGVTSRMFMRSFETKLTEFDKFEGGQNLIGSFFESKLLASREMVI